MSAKTNNNFIVLENIELFKRVFQGNKYPFSIKKYVFNANLPLVCLLIKYFFYQYKVVNVF